MKSTILMIHEYSHGEENMVMTMDDFLKYIHNPISSCTKSTTEVLKDLDKTLVTDLSWVSMHMSNDTYLSARFCKDDKQLKRFITGDYNEENKPWYFKLENSSDVCVEELNQIKKDMPEQSKINTQPVIAGYEIINKIDFKDRYGAFSSIVMGYNENAPAPWVTWRYFSEYDNYDHGHYFASEQNATKDFFERAIELSKIDLKTEYENERKEAEIRNVLSERYSNRDINYLLMNEAFKSKASEVIDKLDFSDFNETFLKNIERIIVSMKSDLDDIDLPETYVIRIRSAMDTDISYIRVKDISVNEIIEVFEGICLFEELPEEGIDQELICKGADILESWEEDILMSPNHEPIWYYDFEFDADVPGLYDKNGNDLLPHIFGKEMQPVFENKNTSNIENEYQSNKTTFEKLRG